MSVSSISPGQIPESPPSSAVSPADAAKRRQLVQAVKTINANEVFGSGNELTFVFDRAKQRTITRVINRDTKEVVLQVPPEYVLDLAHDLQDGSAS